MTTTLCVRIRLLIAALCMVLLGAMVLMGAACSSDSAPAAIAPAGEPDDETPSEAGTELASEIATAAPANTGSEPSEDDAEALRAAIDAVRATLDPGVQFASQLWPTDWRRSNVDLTELRAGLQNFDTRDGIPPLDDPGYQSVEDAAGWLSQDEPGTLVRIDDQAWFFPLSIMTSHEIVNSTLGGVPVAVTYCPLCNTAIAFDRRVGDEILRFGVSGLLRKSDLVMWDSATTSLWQQITGEAIVGEYAGTKLTPVSTAIVSFGQFVEGFPDGLSLSPDNEFGREYGRNPYPNYSSLDAPLRGFYVAELDERLPALSRVVGVSTATSAKAYPFATLTGEPTVNDTIDDTPIVILWGGPTTDALDASRISEGVVIGSAVAYERTVDGRTLTFEADGDMYRDIETGSMWNILGQAVSGELTGSRLETVTHRNEFWFAFSGFFPEATIYGR